MLSIVEIDADDRIVGARPFDLDDIDAAFEELDARYLAGEAAAHAHTWSVIARTYAAFNRHELPDAGLGQHRPPAAAPSLAADSPAAIRAAWDLTPDLSIHIEAVHRLSGLGAVVTHAAHGTSQEGFDAEWRMIELLTVEGDLINRCELFDEADLDAALARFDELHPPAPRLENAASQVAERFWTYFAARDWDAMAEILADDFCTRRSPSGRERRGPARSRAQIANMRAIAEVGFDEHHVDRHRDPRGAPRPHSHSFLGPRLGTGEVTAEVLSVVEIDTDNRIAGAVIVRLDDIDAAFEELDARYLAGEAAAHAHTWSVIARAYAAFNRHELPDARTGSTSTTGRLATIDASDLPASIRAIWDLTPDVSIYIEAVHRLSNLGAVVTYAAYGTSQEGFDAEWRMIDLLTVEGDRISRCEIFDEADLDAALARFDELQPQAPRLENAATRSRRALPGVLRGPRLGRNGRDTGRRHFHRRSPSVVSSGILTRSRCRDREHASDRRPRGD